MNNIDKDSILIPSYKSKKGHSIIIPNTIIKNLIENQNKFKTTFEAINSYNHKIIEVLDLGISKDIDTDADFIKEKTL